MSSDSDIKTLLGSIAAASPASKRNSFFPAHLIPPNAGAVVRFVTSDPTVLFFRELNEFHFKMGGIVNSPDSDTTEDATVSFPCLNTFGRNDDPILADQRPNWKSADPRKVDEARANYFKKTYVMQGLVVASPFVEKNEPTNPVRLFRIGRQMFEVLMNGLKNGSMDWSPLGDQHGRDFTIRKTLQGSFNNYSTSSWSFKERPWNDAERDAIDRFGYWNLDEVIGPEPDADVIEMGYEIYQASLVGAAFDHAKWGSHFKAFTKTLDNATANAIAANAGNPPTQHEQASQLDTLSQDDTVKSRVANLRNKVRSTG